MQNTRQQARARQQAQEHEAERLRIEIVKLREALDEETAAKASLERQLRVQREETGKGRQSSCHRASWIRYMGIRRRCTGDSVLISSLSLLQTCWRVSRISTLWRVTTVGLGPCGPDLQSPCALTSQPHCAA